ASALDSKGTTPSFGPNRELLPIPQLGNLCGSSSHAKPDEHRQPATSEPPDIDSPPFHHGRVSQHPAAISSTETLEEVRNGQSNHGRHLALFSARGNC